MYYGVPSSPDQYRGEPLKVALPLGIGDVHWVATKLRALSEHHAGRPIHAYINESLNHATIGYLEILPMVSRAFLSERAPFEITSELQPNHRFSRWSTLGGSANWREFDYCLVANGHLERGLPLGTYLPELGPESTDWTYELRISSEDRSVARQLLRESAAVLLYLSGMGPNAGFHNHSWTVANWVEVVALLNAEGLVPLLVGANTRDDLTYEQWFWREAQGRIEARTAVGRTTIPQYCALIEESACWAGLNSGGGIVSAMRGTPTVMLWSDSKFPIVGCEGNLLHTNMRTSWLHSSQLGTYRTLSLGSDDLTSRAVAAKILEVMRK